jgi:putative Holliday junction resolvase
MPFSMDGTLGTQAEKVRGFAEELSRYTSVPLEYRDERLSTVAAKRLVQQIRKTNRSSRFDSAAAALILQGYLDDLLPPKGYQPNEGENT